MALSANPVVQKFLSSNLSELRTEIPGDNKRDFKPEKKRLEDISILINDVIKNAEQHKLGDLIEQMVSPFISRWNEIFDRMATYEPKSDAQNGYRELGQIRQRAESLHLYIFFGKANDSSSDDLPKTFLSIYALAKAKDEDPSNEASSQSKQILKELNARLASAVSVSNQLNSIAAEQTTSDYSQIFNEESSSHSSWKFKIQTNFPFSEIRIGAAELWLIFSIAATTGFFWLVLSETLSKLFVTSGDTGLVLTNLFSRVLIIAICIYLITFSFKQFSINKHLATVNKHRANALNSFKLFIETIDKSDSNARNALMLQVAKAIYEQGLTGHLSSRNQESTSIIEMTKILTQPERHNAA